LLLVACLFFNCEKKSSTEPEQPATTGSVTDIDGNVYRMVKIGDQWWMAENLKVKRFRNGDAIPNVIRNGDWTNLATEAYCNYNNDSSNTVIYGCLYNWYAVKDSRNIAPSGWHMPSNSEWMILVDFLGGHEVAGGKIKETGTTHWQSPNQGATNESGFSALPGGLRRLDGSYNDIGYYAYLWTSTENNTGLAGYWFLRHNSSAFDRSDYYKQCGISVRCVKD
jgi:uncharacterized protein (TIGR02145 family)